LKKNPGVRFNVWSAARWRHHNMLMIETRYYFGFITSLGNSVKYGMVHSCTTISLLRSVKGKEATRSKCRSNSGFSFSGDGMLQLYRPRSALPYHILFYPDQLRCVYASQNYIIAPYGRIACLIVVFFNDYEECYVTFIWLVWWRLLKVKVPLQKHCDFASAFKRRHPKRRPTGTSEHCSHLHYSRMTCRNCCIALAYDLWLIIATSVGQQEQPFHYSDWYDV